MRARILSRSTTFRLPRASFAQQIVPKPDEERQIFVENTDRPPMDLTAPPTEAEKAEFSYVMGEFEKIAYTDLNT